MGIHDCEECGHPKERHVKKRGRCRDCDCNYFKEDRSTEVRK